MRKVFGKIENGAVIPCGRPHRRPIAGAKFPSILGMLARSIRHPAKPCAGIPTIPRPSNLDWRIDRRTGTELSVPLQRRLERFQRPTVGAIPQSSRSYKQTVTYLARERLARPSSGHLAKQLLRASSPEATEFRQTSRYISKIR